MKIKLHDIRESKVWQEANEEGREQGQGEGDERRLKATINTLLAKRKTLEEIAELLDIPLDTIRHLASDLEPGRA